jgi:hypothetical protein
MKFKITDKISNQDEEAIFQKLLEYNLAQIEDKNPKDLGVYLQDEKRGHACRFDWKYSW